MRSSNTTGKESFFETEDFDNLAGFFDLLARFDYEDKQKEELVSSSAPLVNNDRGSELGTNNQISQE